MISLVLKTLRAFVESLRALALQANYRLTSILEKPEDTLLKLAFGPTIWMSIRIGVELNLFAIISEKKTCTVHELAKKSGADEVLIRRVLRPLTALGYVAEKGDGVYGETKFTKQLSQRVTEGMVRYMYDIGMRAIAETPSWLAQNTNFQNPTDGADGPWQKPFGGEGLPFFHWLARPENKHHWDNANTFFEGDRAGRLSWVDWFPVREKLLGGARGLDCDDGAAPLLVDVAGGRGHDLVEFWERFCGPEKTRSSSRLVLQDQQPVLDSVGELPDGVEKKAIDFFKEAPVPDARVYFLKFILHDWSDDNCRQILDNVKAAMKQGYSYLVINDFILPDEGCPILPAEFDLILMVYMCGMERTRSQWRTLLESAGLQVEGLYQPPGVGQGIIVAKLQ